MVTAFNYAEKYHSPVVFLMDEVISHIRENTFLPDKDELELINRKSPQVKPEDFITYQDTEDAISPLPAFGRGYRFHTTGLTHGQRGFPTSNLSVISHKVDKLQKKIENADLDIKSVFHPAEIKGYVFIEATPGNIHKAIQGLMHVRGMIEKPVRLEEIQHFLEPKKARIAISMGDIVEIIGGPFKGEKGKITRIDKVKEEVTIELLEASIPIPVTVSTEFVKIIKKAVQEKTEEEQQEAGSEKEPEKSIL